MYDESLSVLLRMEKYFIKSGKEIFFLVIAPAEVVEKEN